MDRLLDRPGFQLRLAALRRTLDRRRRPSVAAAIPDGAFVTDGKSADREPYWSPDGNLLDYLSDRDGFRCIWAQRLERITRLPVGPPVAVYHFHSARRSLANVSSATGLVGLSIAADQVVFAQGEAVGNIRMMDLSARR